MCALCLLPCSGKHSGDAQRAANAQASVAQLLCSPHPGSSRIAVPRLDESAADFMLLRPRGGNRIPFWTVQSQDAADGTLLWGAHTIGVPAEYRLACVAKQ